MLKSFLISQFLFSGPCSLVSSLIDYFFVLTYHRSHHILFEQFLFLYSLPFYLFIRSKIPSAVDLRKFRVKLSVLLAEFFEFLILLLQDFNNLMLFQCYLLLFILFISSGTSMKNCVKKLYLLHYPFCKFI